ncbi:cupin domain-containing protein [Halopiger aswanensis]|uniref:Cupin domain-containing protein n=1 Tax=Halopiger aswanensis TaxID=148449 RepID=A0A3R7GWN3_9EURY|nr:cupin domain-containing protein [Halopiger aswanensis]RKD95796.1 Cupin domain-containing protein [Halopiger aswanensis]
METVSIDDLEPEPDDEELHTDRRDIAAPLNADHVAIVRYVLEPGERFSGSVHAHADQEEVFVVLEGEATFEIGGVASESDSEPETREVAVGENEAIRFAPGEFQSGRNAADEQLVALALGAPRESEDVRISQIPVLDDRSVDCPDCGRDNMRISRREDVDFECPDCDATLSLEAE